MVTSNRRNYIEGCLVQYFIPWFMCNHRPGTCQKCTMDHLNGPQGALLDHGSGLLDQVSGGHLGCSRAIHRCSRSISHVFQGSFHRCSRSTQRYSRVHPQIDLVTFTIICIIHHKNCFSEEIVNLMVKSFRLH